MKPHKWAKEINQKYVMCFPRWRVNKKEYYEQIYLMELLLGIKK